MKIRGIFWIWTGIIILMVIVISLSLALRHVQTKALPLVVSSIVLVLAAAALRRELSGGRLSEAPASETAETGGEEGELGGRWRGHWVGMGWLAGFLLAIYVIGFLMAMPLFTLLTMRRLGAKWPAAIMYAGLITAVIYGIFDFLLRVTLYRGLLWELLGY